MHDTGESDDRLADAIGIVERAPVGRLAIAPDGLLELGALVLRGGRVYIVPRAGVSDVQLGILRSEAGRAAVIGADQHWRRCGRAWVTCVVQSSTSSRESRTACSSAGASGRSFARLPHARS